MILSMIIDLSLSIEIEMLVHAQMLKEYISKNGLHFVFESYGDKKVKL